MGPVSPLISTPLIKLKRVELQYILYIPDGPCESPHLHPIDKVEESGATVYTVYT